MKKNFGFTLAEVLITLAVIGVIASVTLPTLLTNIQINELQTQFKRAYSDLNAFAGYFQAHNDMSASLYSSVYGAGFHDEYAKYMAKTTKMTNTSVWGIANSNGQIASPYNYRSLTNAFGGAAVGGICDNSVYMMDGLGRIIFFDDPPARGYNGPRICVDINGVKKPNTWGIDVFSFLFTIDGSVIPEGEPHKYSKTYTEDQYDYEKGIGAAWQAQTTTGPTSCYNNSNGQTCAYYALQDKSPKNSNLTYWKDFIGKKQYLK